MLWDPTCAYMYMWVCVIIYNDSTMWSWNTQNLVASPCCVVHMAGCAPRLLPAQPTLDLTHLWSISSENQCLYCMNLVFSRVFPNMYIYIYIMMNYFNIIYIIYHIYIYILSIGIVAIWGHQWTQSFPARRLCSSGLTMQTCSKSRTFRVGSANGVDGILGVKFNCYN